MKYLTNCCRLLIDGGCSFIVQKSLTSTRVQPLRIIPIAVFAALGFLVLRVTGWSFLEFIEPILPPVFRHRSSLQELLQSNRLGLPKDTTRPMRQHDRGVCFRSLPTRQAWWSDSSPPIPKSVWWLVSGAGCEPHEWCGWIFFSWLANDYEVALHPVFADAFFGKAIDESLFDLFFALWNARLFIGGFIFHGVCGISSFPTGDWLSDDPANWHGWTSGQTWLVAKVLSGFARTRVRHRG